MISALVFLGLPFTREFKKLPQLLAGGGFPESEPKVWRKIDPEADRSPINDIIGSLAHASELEP